MASARAESKAAARAAHEEAAASAKAAGQFSYEEGVENFELDETTSKIFSFRGISMRALREILDKVLSGELAPGVGLFVATTDLSDQVTEGRTIACMLDDATAGIAPGTGLVGRVAYVEGEVHFVPGVNADFKPRENWTTEDVAEQIVIPRTQNWEETPFYFEHPDLEPADRGEEFQGFFVSQARKCRFRDLVQALEAHLASVPKEEHFVWLDIISANQPVLTADGSTLPEHIAEVKKKVVIYGLHAALVRFNGRLLFLDSWEEPVPLQRTWCVWEIYAAVRYDRAFRIILSPGQENEFAMALHRDPAIVARLAATLDMRKATCFQPADQELIESAVENCVPGGISHLNDVVNRQIRSWVAHAATDLIKWSRTMLPKTRSERDSAVYLTTILSRTGDLFQQLGSYARSLEVAREALERMEASSDYDEHKAAIQRYNVAHVQEELGQNEAAHENYQKALDVFEGVGDRERVAETLSSLGSVLETTNGDWEDIFQVYERALRIYESELRPAHLEGVARVKNKMAAALSAQGKYQEAKVNLYGIMSLYCKVYPSKTPHYIPLLENIAEAHRGLQEFNEAWGFLAKAIELGTEILGNDHPDTAVSHRHMAELLHQMNRPLEALVHIEHACRAFAEALGPGTHANEVFMNRFAADICVSVGELAQDEGRQEDAQEFCARAIERYDWALGHAETAGVLALEPGFKSSVNESKARALRLNGCLESALEHFKLARDAQSRATESTNADKARILMEECAILCKSEGRAMDALARCEDALALIPGRLEQLNRNPAMDFITLAMPFIQGSRADVGSRFLIAAKRLLETEPTRANVAEEIQQLDYLLALAQAGMRRA